MDMKTLGGLAFVGLMALAGAVAGRLIWQHNHLDLINERNPKYSYSVDWTISIIVFTILIYSAAQVKVFARPGDATKVLGACSILLATYLLGWKPRWFWKW